MGHEVKQYMLILRAYPDEWASDFSEELKIEAAQDVIAPLAPSGFALASVAEGIQLTWTNPTLNYDGTPCNDLAWIAVYRKADSGGIDPDNPASYDKRTLIQGEAYTFPSTASGTTFYFLLTAIDVTGNESEVTSELDDEPGAAVSADTDIPDDASGLIFKDAIGGDGVVSGHGILGIAFNAPADAWVHFDRYRLWWQYSTDGSIWRDADGVQDQWTEIAPLKRIGHMHKGLDSTGTKAYRYKATVYATDGTESSTADTAGGAATTADGANNNDLLAVSIFAMNIVALGEVTANDITCANLAAINADLGAITAGSININNVFTVSAVGAVVMTSATVTGAITATSGTIGGFTCDATEGLYAGAAATRIQMKVGVGLWLGATAFADATFKVSPAGAVACSDIVITGGTLTGADIRTAESGARAQITSTGGWGGSQHVFEVYDADRLRSLLGSGEIALYSSGDLQMVYANAYNGVGTFRVNTSLAASCFIVTGSRSLYIAKITQDDSSAAVPCLVINQADPSEGFINFEGQDRGVITGATNSVKSVRAELYGVVYRLALYADG